MKIELHKLTDSVELVGKIFWICDFRCPDLTKKPARNVRPTKAMLVDIKEAKKAIYYSLTYFSEVSKDGNRKKSSEIGIFDNTGYRFREGVPLNVFDNKNECIEFYRAQCDEVINQLEEKRKTALQNIDKDIKEVKKLKQLEQENG